MTSYEVHTTNSRSVRTRSVCIAMLAAGCVAVAVGCGSGTEDSSAGGSLDVVFNSGVANIDPAFACDTVEYTVIRSTYDQLLQASPERDKTGASVIEPMLAESYEVSPDNRTYTFTLQDDVKFASGNEVTADDVVFSLQRALDKQACAEYVLTAGLPGNITSIKALDPSTVELSVKEADPLLLQSISSRAASVIDTKLLEEHGGLSKEGDDWLATNTAGSGPYTITEYKPDSQITFEANPNYWQGEPKASEVSMRIVTDPTSLETLVESGEADLAYGVPPKSLDALSGTAEVVANPSQFNTYIGMNTKTGPLADPLVRQALAAAFPTQEVVDQFGYGYAEAFHGPVPPAMPFYADLPVPAQNLDKAHELLDQAGVENLELTLDLENGESTHQEAATVWQDALRQIGVQLDVNALGSSAFTDRVYNFKSEMYIIDDGPTINDPGYFLGYLVKCDDAFNWAQYCNEQVDADLESARFSLDDAERAELYRQIAEQTAADAPYISVMALDHVAVLKSGIDGYVYYDDQVPRFWQIGSA